LKIDPYLGSSSIETPEKILSGVLSLMYNKIKKSLYKACKQPGGSKVRRKYHE